MPLLPESVRETARTHGERVAVVGPHGASLTYAALWDLSGKIVAWLEARGVARGARVGIGAAKSERVVAALLAVLRHGAAHVPVDPKAPADRVEKIFGDAAISAFIGDGPLPDRAPHVPSLFLDDASLAALGPPSDGVAAVTGDDLAWVLYTSGSTGVPKGVALTHENASAFVAWAVETLAPGPEDRFCNHAPFQFDLSVLDLWVPLVTGGSVHLVDEATGQSPKLLVRFIEEHAPTVLYATPSVLGLLAGERTLAAVRAPPRFVLFAGEVFPPKRLRELTLAWPAARYLNLYGPTETNVCTFAEIELPIAESRSEPFPIGRACTHCTAIVRDGVLWIAGPAVFRGYLGRPDLDANVFEEVEGRRFYATGDVVREAPAGTFTYVGRRDRMIKRRGHRVELGEIEAGLHRHAGLREAAVVAPDLGDGPRVVAFVVAASDPPPTIIDLKRHAGRVLLASMSPDAFRFLPSLPKTATDKVDYRALEALVLSEDRARARP